MKGNYNNIVFTINCDLLLEMIFFKIRGETSKFSPFLRKYKRLTEHKSIKDIDYLENTALVNSQLLFDKKLLWKLLQKSKMRSNDEIQDSMIK